MLIENSFPPFRKMAGKVTRVQRMCEVVAAGATEGRSYTLTQLCWIVEQEWGMNPSGSSGLMISQLENAGFVIERQYIDNPLGNVARTVQYVVKSVKGTDPTEYETRLPVFPIPEIPEGYSSTAASSAKHREKKRKIGAGVLVPPLGASLQITEAHLNGAGIVVTLNREWTGHVDQDAVIVGSEVQVLGAGLGTDGVWVQTNDFTMTMKGK